MKRIIIRSRPAEPRRSPLLFDACRFSTSRGRCLVCARLFRHYREVEQRRAEWARWGGC